MEGVLGESFLGKDRPVALAELQGQVICLLFTANWCPPCRAFAATLSDFYVEVNFPKKRLEIIQISSDKDESGFAEHFEAVPWVCIPYGDPRIELIKHRFKLARIPLLLVLNKDGSLAHGTAKTEVETEGSRCFERWLDLVT